ncbi:MAG: hypothetical protein JSW46_00180 [Gemmatimonadota bacterium]|nr:MAG: hypothetical protein JSW46_00180 [Gemmatimonadota bacterium]
MPPRHGRKRGNGRQRSDRKQGHKKSPGRRGIARRLKDHLKATGQSATGLFEQKLQVGSSTAWEWVALKDPVTPSVYYCIELAKKENLNLNWLLLGEEPRLREVMDPGDSLANRLHAEVIRAMMDKGATEEVADRLAPQPEELLEKVLQYFRQNAFLIMTATEAGGWRPGDKEFEEILEHYISFRVGIEGEHRYLGRT